MVCFANSAARSKYVAKLVVFRYLLGCKRNVDVEEEDFQKSDSEGSE